MNQDHSGKIILSCGGGCLLLATLASSLFLLGGISLTESCASQVKQSREQTLRPIQRFLNATSRDDFSTAHALMSQPFQHQHNVDDLRAIVLSHDVLLVGGDASLVGVKTLKNSTLITVEISDNTTIKGVATFSLTAKAPRRIIHFDRGWPSNPSLQRHVSQFLQRHVDALGRGDIAFAHKHITFADLDTFTLFVQEHPQLFSSDAVVRMIDLQDPKTKHAPFNATVLISDRTSNTSRGRVVFSLQRPQNFDATPHTFEIISIQTILDNPTLP